MGPVLGDVLAAAMHVHVPVHDGILDKCVLLLCTQACAAVLDIWCVDSGIETGWGRMQRYVNATVRLRQLVTAPADEPVLRCRCCSQPRLELWLPPPNASAGGSQ